MSSKKKRTPLLWEEIQSVKFTEKQWSEINRHLQLPDQARSLIERNASLYLFHESGHADYQTRSAALAELKTIDRLAEALSFAFKKMGDRSGYALVDTTKNMDGKSAREIWRQRLEVIDGIAADVPVAIDIVRAQKKEKPGPNSFAIDHLVEQLDGIVRRYKKDRINRGKVYVDFMLRVANAADPKITASTIDASLKRIIKKLN